MRYAHAHNAFLEQCRYFAEIAAYLEKATLSIITAETAAESNHRAIRAEAAAQCRNARLNLRLADTVINAADHAGAGLDDYQRIVFGSAEAAARRETAQLRGVLIHVEAKLARRG